MQSPLPRSEFVTRGRLRWVMRLLPDKIPDSHEIKVPAPALKACWERVMVCFSFVELAAVANPERLPR
jgi:hypothetical protein